MTKEDLYLLIDTVVKINPAATDTTKLQGKNHRILLKALVDFVESEVATANGASNGEFPFDWTLPSNAFNNYSNSSTTFKSGFFKFLHRDQGPSASLSVDRPVRQKGSSTAVTLTYAAQPGTAALTSIVVNGKQVSLQPPYGTQSATTQPNQDTTFQMAVSDANGYTTPASASVHYRNKLFIFSSSQDLFTLTDAALSVVLNSQNAQLVDSRQQSQNVSTNDEYLYISYQADFGSDAKLITNNIQDTSFLNEVFAYTNSDNYQTQFILFKGSNLLTGMYNVTIQ